MGKRILTNWILILATVFILSGCGKINSGVSVTSNSEGVAYTREYINLGIVPEHDVYEYAISKTEFWFNEYIENEEDGSVYSAILKKPIDESSGIVDTGITVEDTVVRICSPNENDELWVGCQNDEMIYFNCYSNTGVLVKTVKLTDTSGGFNEYFYTNKYGDGFVAANLEEVNFFGDDGSKVFSVRMPKDVSEEFFLYDETLYACIYYGLSNKSVIAKIDFVNSNCVEKEYSFPGKVKVFALDDCLLMIEPDAVQKVDADNGKTELLLDLKSNHLNSADIMEINGSADNMDVLCFRMAQNGEVELYRLNRASDEEAIEIAQKTQDVKYTEDGRRIIKLVSEGTFIAFDWYVQYYNLHSDKYYVEINKIDEDINDYLGKGGDADVLYLSDSYDVQNLGEKEILVDLVPYIKAENKFSVDKILPQVKEICGSDGSLYALSPLFKITGIVTDGTWVDENGKCDTVSFIKHYDQYYTNLGIGLLDEYCVFNPLYYDIGHFYDKESKTCDFESTEFKQIMQVIKSTIDNHETFVDINEFNDLDTKEFWISEGIYNIENIDGDIYLLGCEYEGCPCVDGSVNSFIAMSDLLGIFVNSDCKDGAYEFISNYLDIFSPAIFTEGGVRIERNSELSTGYLPIFTDRLEKEILGEDVKIRTFEWSAETGQVGYTLTDEQRAKLRELIYNGKVPSIWDNDVFMIVDDGLHSYIHEGVALDEVCRVIQSRVNLLLNEQ